MRFSEQDLEDFKYAHALLEKPGFWAVFRSIHP